MQKAEGRHVVWRDAFLWWSVQGVVQVNRVSGSQSQKAARNWKAQAETTSAFCLSNRLRDEPVTHPRLGHDVAGAGGVGLELATEGAHVDADGVGSRAGGGAPDAGDDVLDEERLAGID